MKTTLRKFLENDQFIRISLSKLNSNHYKLTAKINDKKGFFILDTGASSSCIAFDKIPFFNLFTEETEIKASGAGAVNMEAMISKNNHLQLGTLSLQKVSLVLFDLSHVNEALSQMDELPVDGIIGADLLKKLHAVIDYGRNCLYIKK